MTKLTELADVIRDAGFALVGSLEMAAVFAEFGPMDDFAPFAASWNDLGLDTYMADGGRYRKRRHAVFRAAPGQPIVREAHAPHYQSRDYNPLNGGIARWFEPVAEPVATSASLGTILATVRGLSDRLQGAATWHIEMHQFRIEARAGTHGRPTPEGRHRDGVDVVLVLLINRVNIREGVTTVSAPDGRELGSFTLTNPLDAAVVDDLRVLHGVTPVVPEDPAKPGYRDVLVVTFRREG